MKRWILLLTLVVAGGSVIAQNLDLRSDVDQLREVVYRRGHTLPRVQQREVSMKIQELRDFIWYGGQPQPAARFYCAAACVRNDRVTPDLRYSAGAEAVFELEAKNLARQEVQKKWSCNFGVVDIECSADDYRDRFCISGCQKNNGEIDMRYLGGSSGRTVTEAKTLARTGTQAKFSCNFGVKDYSCSNGEVKPTYCVAACQSNAGQPDLRYSKGASGNNEVEATFNAIESVRTQYSCNFGIVITECSN